MNPPNRRGLRLAMVLVGSWATWVAWSRLSPPPDLARAIALAKAGRFDEAEAIVREDLRRDPGHARAHMLAAQFALRRPVPPRPDGTPDDPATPLRALDHLGRIRDADRGLSALVALYRGKAQSRLGRLTEAESSWEEALALDPLVPEAAWHLLEIYYLQGRPESSLRLALKGHAVEPDPRDRVQFLLELLRQEAQPPAAESLARLFAPIVGANPDDIRARIAYGLALGRCGRIDEGLESLRHAVRTRPDHPDTWEAWLTGLEEAGQIGALARAFDRLPNALADSPQFAGFAARVAQERGDGESASALYRRAIAARPRDRSLEFRLIRVLYDSGQVGEAERRARALRDVQDAALEVPALYRELNATPTLGTAPHPELYRRAAVLRERMGAREEALAWHGLALRDLPGDTASRAALERLAAPSTAAEEGIPAERDPDRTLESERSSRASPLATRQ